MYLLREYTNAYIGVLAVIMNKHFVSILILILGCATKPTLTVRELKFPDYEKDNLSLNNIDTTYFIGKNTLVKWSYGELVNGDANDTAKFFNWKFEKVGFVKYDSLGRAIRDETKRWKTYTYQYDDFGILNYIVYRDWDVTPKYKSTYTFLPDSLILYQHWTQDSKLHHVSKFLFNDEGLLTEEFNNDNDNTGNITRNTHRIYQYTDGKLIIKKETIDIDGITDVETNTTLYYSGQSRLDSTVCQVQSKKEGSYKMVTYYDNLGLKLKTVLMDTVLIQYLHIKRQGS